MERERCRKSAHNQQQSRCTVAYPTNPKRKGEIEKRVREREMQEKRAHRHTPSRALTHTHKAHAHTQSKKKMKVRGDLHVFKDTVSSCKPEGREPEGSQKGASRKGSQKGEKNAPGWGTLRGSYKRTKGNKK